MAVKNKIALVTGANRGLGFETCRQLAQLGLTVILSARDLAKGQTAAKILIGKGLDVIFYQLDVSDQINISRITHQIEQEFGQLDVLVNNAAILYDTWQNAVDADLCRQ
jgi:NAD(P)-dependent dehydrogenase (short-subunit alcohol dehydrogenase family)